MWFETAGGVARDQGSKFVGQSWSGPPRMIPLLPFPLRSLPILSSLPFPFTCPPCLPSFPPRRKLKRPSRILLVDWGSAVSYPSAGSGGTRPRQQKHFWYVWSPETCFVEPKCPSLPRKPAELSAIRYFFSQFSILEYFATLEIPPL